MMKHLDAKTLLIWKTFISQQQSVRAGIYQIESIVIGILPENVRRNSNKIE